MTQQQGSAMPTRQVSLGGRDLTITFNMKAVARLEDIYDLPVKRIAKRFLPKPVFDDVTDAPVMVPAVDDKGVQVEPLRMVQAMAPEVRVTDLQRILWASLAEHHPAITLDQTLDLLQSEMESKGVLDGAISATFDAWSSSGDRGDGSEAAAPPSPQTGATTSASISTG